MDFEYRHEGKKPRKFFYTFFELAQVAGLSYQTVRRYAWMGKFDPHSLSSVIQFINSRKNRH